MHAAWKFWSVLVSSHGFFGAVMLRHAKTPRTNESERVRATTCATWLLQYRDSPGLYSYPIQPRAVPRSRSFQIILCRVASAFDPPSVPMVVVDDFGTPGWVPELHKIIYTCISYGIYMLYNTYSYIMSIIIYVCIYIYMWFTFDIYIYIYTCNIWYIYMIYWYIVYIYIYIYHIFQGVIIK